MSAYQQLLVGGFATAFLVGVAAQASSFCPQGGLREAMLQARPARLAAYAVSIAAALFGVAALQAVLGQSLAPARPPYLAPVLPWGRYIFGGLLFGVGMALARGCPLRTAIRLGQGSPWALVLLLVMAAAAYLFSRTALFDRGVAPWLLPLSVDLRKWNVPGQGLDAVLGWSSPGARIALGAGVGLVILLLAKPGLPWRGNLAKWVAAAGIGLMVAMGYALTAGPIGMRALDDASFMSEPPEGLGAQSFSYAGPLSDALHFALRPATTTFTLSAVILLATVAGALVSAVVRREFRLQRFDSGAHPVRQVAGAALTGAGAVIGLGCTVGHGLSGIAVLSTGSMLALLSIFAGAALVVWVEHLAPNVRRPFPPVPDCEA
jgi:uncharacterized protein